MPTRKPKASKPRPRAVVFTPRGWPLAEGLLRALPLPPAMLDRASYLCAIRGPEPSIFDRVPEPPFPRDEALGELVWDRVSARLFLAIWSDPASGLGGVEQQRCGSHTGSSLEELARSLEEDGYEVLTVQDVLAAHVEAARAAAIRDEPKELRALVRRLSGGEAGIWKSHAKRPEDAAAIARMTAFLEHGGELAPISSDPELVDSIRRSLAYPPRIAPRAAIEAWTTLDDRLFELNRRMHALENVALDMDAEGVVARFPLFLERLARAGFGAGERLRIALASFTSLDGSGLHHVAGTLREDTPGLVAALEAQATPWVTVHQLVLRLSALGEPALFDAALRVLEAHPDWARVPSTLTVLLEADEAAYIDRVASLAPDVATIAEHERGDWEPLLRKLRKHDPERFAKPRKGKAKKKTPPALPDLRTTVLAKHERTAHLPEWKAGDGGLSKAGGSASLGDEPWPACPCCNEPMPLLLQLDLASVPGALGIGLLQVFWCTSTAPLCEVETEAYFAGEGARPKSKLVRVLRALPMRTATKPPRAIAKAIPARVITGWKAQADWPMSIELMRVDEPAADFCETLGDGYHAATIGSDKLGGWPRWEQDLEYPACKRCHAPMSNLLFQLASDGLSSTQWGDVGRAYVLCCRAHPNEVDLLSQSG